MRPKRGLIFDRDLDFPGMYMEALRERTQGTPLGPAALAELESRYRCL
jgi:hypothetical protein